LRVRSSTGAAAMIFAQASIARLTAVPMAPDELSTCSRAGETFSRKRTAPVAASAGSFFATFWISAVASRTRCTAGCERQPNACLRKRGANAHLCAGGLVIDNHA
jgi:hypothetical protein